MRREPNPAPNQSSDRDLSAIADIGTLSKIAGERIRRSATEVPQNLDDWWIKGRCATPGPIDLIDMFSGCGGMSCGFIIANAVVPAFRLSAAFDIDSRSNETYRSNLGVEPRNRDISELVNDRTQLNGLNPEGRPLVLIGCAPCQGFSSHRNRSGLGDSRNQLFLDFAQIAVKLKPTMIVAENVPELFTDRYWRFTQRVRDVLETSGYYVHMAVHNLAAFGVPQERFRALIMASRKPFRPPVGFLPRERFRTVRQALSHLPAIAPGQRCDEDELHYSAGHKESTIRTIQAIPKNGGSRPIDVGPPCLARAQERNGKPAYEDVYGRLHWDRPAITITGYARNPASGRFVHPEQDRGLSVREAALLQGFPSRYWFSGSLDERFKQIGNAVPPVFSAHLALHLLNELLSTAPDESFDRGLTEPVCSSFARLIPALKGHDAGRSQQDASYSDKA